MLQSANSYVTWGEVTKETVTAMLEKRARLAGNKKLTAEYLDKLGFKTFEELADAIMTGKAEHSKLPFMTTTLQTAPANKRLQGQNQESLQSRRRSRIPRRSNQRTRKTHDLKRSRLSF